MRRDNAMGDAGYDDNDAQNFHSDSTCIAQGTDGERSARK